MPRISTFFGIEIWMYYNDHQPPHFHATYGEQEALILIGSGDLYEGNLSRRGLRLCKNGKNCITGSYWRTGNWRAMRSHSSRSRPSRREERTNANSRARAIRRTA